MGRKQKTISSSKERFIGFRVTNELYEVIATEATLANLSISEYCRTLALNKKVIMKKEVIFDSQELLAALSSLGKIGSNLNQIARHLNSENSWTSSMKEEVQHCIAELREIRENIKEMAGEYRGSN